MSPYTAQSTESQPAHTKGCHLKGKSQFILYCTGKQDENHWVEFTGSVILPQFEEELFNN